MLTFDGLIVAADGIPRWSPSLFLVTNYCVCNCMCLHYVRPLLQYATCVQSLSYANAVKLVVRVQPKITRLLP